MCHSQMLYLIPNTPLTSWWRSASELPVGWSSAVVCSWMTCCTLFFGEPHSYCFSSPWLDGFRTPSLYLLPFPTPHLLTANPCIFSQRRGCSLCFTLGLQTLCRVKSCSLSEQQGERGLGIWARGHPPKWVSRIWVWEI